MTRRNIFTRLQLLLVLFAITCAGSFASSQSNEQDDFELIMSRISDTYEEAVDINDLTSKLKLHLNTYNDEGCFSDLDYDHRGQTNWIPTIHAERIQDFAFAYTIKSAANPYYQDAGMYKRIVKSLEYWYAKDPRSSNWWYNEISWPQIVGLTLVQMRKGHEKVPQDIESKILERMKLKGGNPTKQTGPNKTDIAMHWLYRAVLTKDTELLKTTMEQAFMPLILVTGEGIQYDYSYHQHGNQLYIGGYGDVLIKGTSEFGMYAAGTKFALKPDQLKIFSQFTRGSYLRSIHGIHQSYTAMGRILSRDGGTNKVEMAKWMGYMKKLDVEHTAEYDEAIARLSSQKPASYARKVQSTNFFISDLLLHTRPGYSFDVRAVSSRLFRLERINEENHKGYFVSDGSNSITIGGDEYASIFPIWNWARVPGTTTPQFEVIPKAVKTMSTKGTSSFVGGVSDSLYSAFTYSYTDYSLNVNTEAKKSWFCFDNEVVCLGAGIKSLSDFEINTTLNQCLLGGKEPTISEKRNSTILSKGEYHYPNSLDWVMHNGIAYLFPDGGQCSSW